jgi:hypothetical protein
MTLDIVKQGKLSIGEAIVEHPASTFGYQEKVKQILLLMFDCKQAKY